MDEAEGKYNISLLETLPYDVFSEFIINQLSIEDVSRLCNASKGLQQLCDNRKGILYEKIAKKYLLECYISYKSVLPYLPTEIWDKYMLPVVNKVYRDGSLTDFINSNGYATSEDFVVPDIVFQSFAKSTKTSISKVLKFFFGSENEGFVGGKYSPFYSHFGTKIHRNKNVILKKVDIFKLISFDGNNYGTDYSNQNGDIRINDKIKVIGKLKPYPGFENTRNLVNGIILGPDDVTLWLRFLILSKFIGPGDEISFTRNSFIVTNSNVEKLFSTSETIDLFNSKYKPNQKWTISDFYYNLETTSLEFEILIISGKLLANVNIQGKISFNFSGKEEEY